MTTTTTTRTTYFVAPCGAAKAGQPMPARDLYTGSAFRHVLAAVEAEAAATARDLGGEVVVLILSAKHGLVGLDEVLAPYDVTMNDADAITVDGLAATAIAAGIEYGHEVYAWLPAAYRTRLDAALEAIDGPWLQDVYEAAPGIGYQRGVCSSMNRYRDAA